MLTFRTSDMKVHVHHARHVDLIDQGISDLRLTRQECDATDDNSKQLCTCTTAKARNLQLHDRYEKEKIARFLSNICQTDRHLAIRATALREIGTWFLEHHEFREWRDEYGSSVLWLNGDRKFAISIGLHIRIGNITYNRFSWDGKDAFDVRFCFMYLDDYTLHIAD